MGHLRGEEKALESQGCIFVFCFELCLAPRQASLNGPILCHRMCWLCWLVDRILQACLLCNQHCCPVSRGPVWTGPLMSEGSRGEELTLTLAVACSSPSKSSHGDRHGWMAAWMEHSVTHLSSFSPSECEMFAFLQRGAVSLLILKTATCEERGCSLTTLHHWRL